MEHLKRKKLQQQILFWLFALLAFSSLVHVIRTHQLEGSLKTILILSLPLFMLFGFVARNAKKNIHFIPPPRFKHSPAVIVIVQLLIVLIFALSFGSVIYIAASALTDLLIWIKSFIISSENAAKTAISFTLIAGILLFLFRLYYRSLYGITEVLIGLIVSGNKISENGLNHLNSNFYLALLTAGVYLVVRGLDNIHIGFTKLPVDPFALKTKMIFDKMMQLVESRL